MESKYKSRNRNANADSEYDKYLKQQNRNKNPEPDISPFTFDQSKENHQRTFGPKKDNEREK